MKFSRNQIIGAVIVLFLILVASFLRVYLSGVSVI